MNPTKIIVYRGCESYQNRVNGYIDSDVAIINVSKQLKSPRARRAPEDKLVNHLHLYYANIVLYQQQPG